MLSSRNIIFYCLALAPLSCHKGSSNSAISHASHGSSDAPKWVDYCVPAGDAVGSVPDAFKAKMAPGTPDNSDFPSVPIDENTLAVVTLYDNPSWQGQGRCTFVLTKSKSSVSLVNGDYQYQYNSERGWGEVSRAKSVKLFYLTNGSHITFSAGGYNPGQINYLPKPSMCYEYVNPNASIIAGSPYCNPTSYSNMLKDASTGFTVEHTGMLGSLSRVVTGPGIDVRGDGKGGMNFENVITKIEVTQ